MARRIRSCLAFVCVVVLFGACKVSTSGSSSTADDARPNSSDGSSKPNSDDGEGGANAFEPIPATSADQGATDASGTLSAGATCEDAGHEIGDSWKDDCNNCNCTEDGLVVCTRMACEADGSAPH